MADGYADVSEAGAVDHGQYLTATKINPAAAKPAHTPDDQKSMGELVSRASANKAPAIDPLNTAVDLLIGHGLP